MPGQMRYVNSVLVRPLIPGTIALHTTTSRGDGRHPGAELIC